MAKSITAEDLPDIIADHSAWLAGQGGRRADFRDAYLRGADFRGTNLRRAIFRYADMRYADFSGADLGLADFHYADMRNVDFRRANLRRATFCAACLRRADFREADLSEADLSEADIRFADLRGADVHDADVHDADIRYANLPASHAIASICFGGWAVTVTPKATTVGCQTHPNAAWLAWGVDAPEVAEMHDDAAAWWRRHREAVCTVIRDVMQPVEVVHG